MPKRIILNWSPPVQINIPSPAHSILKAWLEKHDYKVSILYWNLYFFTLQHDFLLSNLKACDEMYNMLLYLNYIAFRNNDQHIYNEIKVILQSINPRHLTSEPDFYARYMESAYKQMEKTIDDLLSSIDFSEVLCWGFAMKMDQWLFASIIAEKIKKIDPTIPIIVGGINTKDNAITYLNKFTQFDYAIWGEGETPLLELLRYLERTNDITTLQQVSNIAYKSNNEILVSNKRNNQYLNMTDLVLFPDYSDFFETRKKLNVDSPVYITIEGSRGCHWNKCHFCYLNTDYKYRLKAIDKITQEIKYMINTYEIFEFQFLDNDLIGKDMERFHLLLDSFIEIKNEFPRFQIVLAEIITKDLDYVTIKKMFDAGIIYAQIGYESASSILLKKINKKNTFSSNLLYVKFANFHKVILGGVNVLTGLPEETTEDIIEACSNLRFLRFFLDYKMFRHVTIPLTVNSSSVYYKEINEDDPIWNLYKLSHIILRNTFNRKDQWKIFEFVRLINNIQWNSFHQIEKYYLTNKHTYRIERDQNKISYKEYINNKNIKSLSWSTDSLEVEILYRTNDKPRSFKKLHSELVASAINRNKSIPDEISLKKSLEFLYNEGLVYYDKSFDASNGENYFENIVSVIVIFYPETTN
ncbi:B12-binding domain-containing radical SAM protein [Odoribacter splanchnicus]|uniref:B12-binding domain-containing radical SAM protein n=1 Tax=Odoribacter splanchnicus TaxID=28118 RepID=UPI0015858F42|nr:radical SAM protein [Odoribacter splanchnicus]NUN81708.1 radical SAM protein [Odoribacter splanchnicus]